jgi:hypothetical protein
VNGQALVRCSAHDYASATVTAKEKDNDPAFVVVSPGYTRIREKKSVQLAARGYDADWVLLDPQPAFLWWTDSLRARVSYVGLFRARKKGIYHVTAYSSPSSGVATVVVYKPGHRWYQFWK